MFDLKCLIKREMRKKNFTRMTVISGKDAKLQMTCNTFTQIETIPLGTYFVI